MVPHILSADTQDRSGLDISLAQSRSSVQPEPLYDPPTDSQASNKVVDSKLGPCKDSDLGPCKDSDLGPCKDSDLGPCKDSTITKQALWVLLTPRAPLGVVVPRDSSFSTAH